jgi:hypothetical protein
MGLGCTGARPIAISLPVRTTHLCLAALHRLTLHTTWPFSLKPLYKGGRAMAQLLKASQLPLNSRPPLFLFI